ARPAEGVGGAARRPRLDGPRHGPGRVGRDGRADIAVQPRQRGAGAELAVPAGEAVLVQRFRRVPGEGPPRIGGAEGEPCPYMIGPTAPAGRASTTSGLPNSSTGFSRASPRGIALTSARHRPSRST